MQCPFKPRLDLGFHLHGGHEAACFTCFFLLLFPLSGFSFTDNQLIGGEELMVSWATFPSVLSPRFPSVLSHWSLICWFKKECLRHPYSNSKIYPWLFSTELWLPQTQGRSVPRYQKARPELLSIFSLKLSESQVSFLVATAEIWGSNCQSDPWGTVSPSGAREAGVISDTAPSSHRQLLKSTAPSVPHPHGHVDTAATDKSQGIYDPLNTQKPQPLFPSKLVCHLVT